MEFLKNRKTAFLILALGIIIFTVIGINRSLSAVASDIEDMFYTGVYIDADGYTSPSVDSQISKRIDAAMGLITIGKHYDLSQETDALKTARNALIDAETLPDKYLANNELEKAYTALYESLSWCGALSGDYGDAISSYVSTLSGAQSVIENSTYNEQVSEYYNHTLRSFPVSVLKPLIFIDGPDYFNVEG